MVEPTMTVPEQPLNDAEIVEAEFENAAITASSHGNIDAIRERHGAALSRLVEAAEQAQRGLKSAIDAADSLSHDAHQARTELVAAESRLRTAETALREIERLRSLIVCEEGEIILNRILAAAEVSA